MVKEIHLMGNDSLLYDLYEKAIEERNELYPENKYELIQTKGENGDTSIQLIHFSEDFDLPYLQNQLKENMELRALVFVKPRDYKTIKAINQLSIEYPLSVLGVVEQPTQPARLWEFLDQVEAKSLHYEWEEGDWDDF